MVGDILLPNALIIEYFFCLEKPLISNVDDFEVYAVEDNDVYGRVISVRHNDNLISVYSNVDNSSFDIGYKVSQGEILGSSKVSEISDDKYMLHFEVMHKGNYIDPENLYTINVSEIQ